MAGYGTEPHPDHGDVALVVRLPDPGEQTGQITGWCTGPGSQDNARDIAAWMRQHGTQPPGEICDTLGYTPREGEEA